MLKIRLTRKGSKKRPFYKIIVADTRSPRDGKFIEILGHYNPLLENDNEQKLILKEDRINYWLSIGSQVSTRMQKLLASKDILKAKKLPEQPLKSAPSKKTLDRIAQKEEKKKTAKEESE